MRQSHVYIMFVSVCQCEARGGGAAGGGGGGSMCQILYR